MKRLFLVISGLLLFIIMATGVLTLVRHLSRAPSTVLTSVDCDPPCWYGIQPGETTSWDVLTALMEQPWLGSIQEQTRRDQVTQFSWTFRRPAGDSFGFAYFEEERCTAISILTVGSLNLADAFARLGEPELIWTHIERTEGREWLEVTLLAPEKGIVIELNYTDPAASESGYIELRGDKPVYRVTYFDPNRFPELLDTIILINEPVRNRAGALRPWPGFGPIAYERR